LPASRRPQRSSGFSRTSAGTQSRSIRRLRAVRRPRASSRSDRSALLAPAPGTGGSWLAAGCASISRWNAKIRPTNHDRSRRLGADVGARRTPLRVRRLHVSSHMGPYTHYPPRYAYQLVPATTTKVAICNAMTVEIADTSFSIGVFMHDFSETGDFSERCRQRSMSACHICAVPQVRFTGRAFIKSKSLYRAGATWCSSAKPH